MDIASTGYKGLTKSAALIGPAEYRVIRYSGKTAQSISASTSASAPSRTGSTTSRPVSSCICATAWAASSATRCTVFSAIPAVSGRVKEPHALARSSYFPYATCEEEDIAAVCFPLPCAARPLHIKKRLGVRITLASRPLKRMFSRSHRSC